MGDQLWPSWLTRVPRLLKSRCLRREVVATLAVLALSPSAWRQAAPEQALLSLQWFVLALGLARGGALERLSWAAAAALSLLAWVMNLGCWSFSVILSSLALVLTAASWDSNSPHRRWCLASFGVGVVAPAALLAGLAFWGGDNIGGLTLELASFWPTGSNDGARLCANGLAALMGFAIADRYWLGKRRLPGALQAAASAGLLGLVLFRARWFMTMLSWPQETQWSEPPFLMNLLKLRLGAPIYGPLEDCNSYAYSPLLELIHHGLLSPWGADLDLGANRLLLLLWHALAIGLSWFALAPYSSRLASARRLGNAIGILLLSLAVTSSLLAPVLHPDQILMIALSAAIVLVVAEDRLPKPVFWLGLLVTPIFATMCKLTGAGLGLGLVLAFARRGCRWRSGVLGVLAASGCLALCTIPLFDATLGDFSLYAIRLQASHPLRFGEWASALAAGPGRAWLVAMLGLGLAWLRYGFDPPGDAHARRDPSAERRALGDAGRLALLTLGFMLTSSVAYLKLGGRDNSLLPLTIGAIAIFIRLAPLSGRYQTLLAPASLAMLLFVAQQAEPPTASARALAEDQQASTVNLIEQELALGRHTLYYNSTLPWLIANPHELPLDRWQTVSELVLGHQPAQAAFWRRLSSGYYASVVVQSHALDEAWSNHAQRFRTTLAQHYLSVSPAQGEPLVHGTPMLFRYRDPAARTP